MEFVSVIRLPLVCVCVCANSYYLFINIYTTHLSLRDMYAHDTKESYICIDIDCKTEERVCKLVREVIEFVKIHTLSNQSTVFFSSFFFIVSFLTASSSKAEIKTFDRKREINSNNYVYWCIFIYQLNNITFPTSLLRIPSNHHLLAECTECVLCIPRHFLSIIDRYFFFFSFLIQTLNHF